MLAVMREVYGYGEKQRRVNRKRLATMMGISDGRVRQLIRQAEEWGLVKRHGWEIEILKDYTQWSKPEPHPSGSETGTPDFRSMPNRNPALPVPNRNPGVTPKPEPRPSAQLQRKKENDVSQSPRSTSTATSDGEYQQQQLDPFINLYHDLQERLQPGAGRQANIRALPYGTNPEEAIAIRERWLRAEEIVGRDILREWVAEAHAGIGSAATLMGHLKQVEERCQLEGARVQAEAAATARGEQVQSEEAETRAFREEQGYVFTDE